MNAVYVVLFGIFCIMVVHIGGYNIIKGYNYIIPTKEWNCTKSRMIDEKNVDKVECIRYEKVIKNDS